MYLLYSAGLALLLLAAAPWVAWRMLRDGKYRAGLSQRLGRVPQHLTPAGEGTHTIWVHAVSVGEVLAISGLVNELRRRWPDRRIIVSTTTHTGHQLARQRFGEPDVAYFPLDFAFAIRPYLRALRPELVLVAETEYWPNFLRLARAAGARIAVVNARISDRSFPRYRRAAALLRRVLGQIDAFLAQTDEDARRLEAIGAPRARVSVTGNLKFDIVPVTTSPLVASLRAALSRASVPPVIVCGSTVAGEEPLVLQAFAQVRTRFPEAVLLLAPRHPERFAEVAVLLAASGLQFWRRSAWHADEAALAGGVFLLDSIGELAVVYSLAQVAFVGGSLAPRGGHNVLEPAQHGVPVLVGPYTQNFRDITTVFRRAGALRVVANATELGAAFVGLLSSPAERQAMGQAAVEVLASGAGATRRTADALERLVAAPRSQTPSIQNV